MHVTYIQFGELCNSEKYITTSCFIFNQKNNIDKDSKHFSRNNINLHQFMEVLVAYSGKNPSK